MDDKKKNVLIVTLCYDGEKYASFPAGFMSKHPFTDEFKEKLGETASKLAGNAMRILEDTHNG